MSKRIKSFFITAVSLLGTAFVAVTATPAWSSFLNYAHDKALGMGIPAVVITLVGVLVSEIWKAILNAQTLKNVENGSVAASRSLDLY